MRPVDMQIPSPLLAQIEQSATRAPSPAMTLLIRDILERFGCNVQAILFYGSCLRTGDELEGLVDLYVLVDAYRAAYRVPFHAALNRWLPPNVFYLEIPFDGRTVRAKYAVLSLPDFQEGTSPRWFHSYLWGRFCQPAGMVYARDDRAATVVNRSLARAVVTFITRTLPCMPQAFTARELWRRGLELSYRAELRSERPDRQVRLYDAAPAYFEGVTRHALDAMPWSVTAVTADGAVRFRATIPQPVRLMSRAAWRLRMLQGKILSILRLLKGMLTFEGGVDYILWKIKRHSGVTVDVEPRLRRHPLLAAGILAWRVFRRGGFR
ncbi:MAG: hypothetical protein MUP74_03860 [Desulfobacterales bacterium]|nr:hypothetical protein [Desulfobacterales bacterium]